MNSSFLNNYKKIYKALYSPKSPNNLVFMLCICTNGSGFEAGGTYFKPLPWFLRVKVALDAAKGLAFLHSDPVKVIYRDIKASNILLDAVRQRTMY